MGIIQNILEKLRRKREKMSDASEDVHIQQKIQERQLSSEERELLRYQKEEHDKRIHNAVEHYRKKRQDEWWKGSNLLDKRNIFKEQDSIMKDNKKLYSKGRMFIN